MIKTRAMTIRSEDNLVYIYLNRVIFAKAIHETFTAAGRSLFTFAIAFATKGHNLFGDVYTGPSIDWHLISRFRQ